MLESPAQFFHPRMLLSALWHGWLRPLAARLPLVGARLGAGAGSSGASPA